MGKFLAVVRMAINDAVIYRSDILMWAFSLLLGPLIYLIIWLALSISGGKPPLTQSEFVQYYLLVMLVRTWANSWNSQFIANDIRTGAISPFLIRPIPYLSYRFGDSVGNRIIKAVFGLTAILILGIFFKVSIPNADIFQWLSFGLSFLMAGILMTISDIIIGLLAFWFDDITAIDEFYDVFYMIFSGVVLPLVIFPEFIQKVLIFLPFKYMLAFPVEILMGEATGSDIALGLIIQALWLILFFGLYKFLWTKGQIKYQAFGA